MSESSEVPPSPSISSNDPSFLLTDLDKKHILAFLNEELANDPEMSYIIPFETDALESLLDACKDGFLLATLLAHKNPKLIDISKIYKKPKLDIFKIQNIDLVLNSLKSMGIRPSGVVAVDIMRGAPNAVYSTLIMILKLYLSVEDPLVNSRVNFKKEEKIINDWIKTKAQTDGYDVQLDDSFASLAVIGHAINTIYKECGLSDTLVVGELDAGSLIKLISESLNSNGVKHFLSEKTEFGFSATDSLFLALLYRNSTKGLIGTNTTSKQTVAQKDRPSGLAVKTSTSMEALFRNSSPQTNPSLSNLRISPMKKKNQTDDVSYSPLSKSNSKSSLESLSPAPTMTNEEFNKIIREIEEVSQNTNISPLLKSAKNLVNTLLTENMQLKKEAEKVRSRSASNLSINEKAQSSNERVKELERELEKIRKENLDLILFKEQSSPGSIDGKQKTKLDWGQDITT